MKKIVLLSLLVFNFLLAFGGEVDTNDEVDSGFTFPLPEGELPALPLFPSIPTTGKDIDEYGQVRMLKKTYTVMMESRVDIFVPLEVITDINIENSVIGDQIVDIPFEVELNRKPEKENYYSIKYSENMLDIDGDGSSDTYIFSPKYINERVSKNNFVRVYGENISKDGTYKKDIYITVEVGD